MRGSTRDLPDDPDDVAAAEAVAVRILGGAAQSAAALTRRLSRRGFSASAVTGAVSRCRELGYIDDAALAQSVVARHRRANRGRVRIVADLRARGVEAADITDATAQLESDEQDAAVAAAEQLRARIASDDRLDQRTRQRIGAALQRRGFTGGVIVRALRGLE